MPDHAHGGIAGIRADILSRPCWSSQALADMVCPKPPTRRPTAATMHGSRNGQPISAVERMLPRARWRICSLQLSIRDKPALDRLSAARRCSRRNNVEAFQRCVRVEAPTGIQDRTYSRPPSLKADEGGRERSARRMHAAARCQLHFHSSGDGVAQSAATCIQPTEAHAPPAQRRTSTDVPAGRHRRYRHRHRAHAAASFAVAGSAPCHRAPASPPPEPPRRPPHSSCR